MDSGTPKYEDWLKTSKDKTIQSADTTYADATRQSEVARQRAIVDADASYQKNVSDYGANAERLASMGLTNSGYADYQKSQSYAQMRGEVQYANAQKVASDKQAAYNRDQTKLGAEITYAQGMANKALSDEQTKNTTYLELLSGAGNGTYSEEQIRALGTQAGLSEEQIANIVGVCTTNEQNISNEKTAAKATSLKTVEALAASVTTEADKAAVIAKAYELGLTEEDITGIIGQMDSRISTATTETETSTYLTDIASDFDNGLTTAESMLNDLVTKGYATKDKNGMITWTNDDAKDIYDLAVKTETTAYLTGIANRFDNGLIAADDILSEFKTRGYVDQNGTWSNDVAKDIYDAATKAETERNENDLSTWIYNAESGSLTSDDKQDIIKAYNNGAGWLAEEDYNEIVSMHLDYLNISDEMYKNGREYMTPEQAKRELDKITKDPLIAEDLRKKAKQIYDDQYSVIDNNRTVDATLKDNGKLKVTIRTGYQTEAENRQYVVDAERVTNAEDVKHLKEVAENVGAEELFGYNGEIYFKASDGTIYKVEQWNNQKGDYHNVFGWISGKW